MVETTETRSMTCRYVQQLRRCRLTTGFERGPIAWMICRSLMIPYNVVPNPAGNGRCQARKWPTGQSTGLSSNGSSCRTEFRSRICARHGPPRPHLHRDTVGFVGSGAGCGRSRSNPSREFEAHCGASAAKSEHWHAPLIRLRQLTSPLPRFFQDISPGHCSWRHFGVTVAKDLLCN